MPFTDVSFNIVTFGQSLYSPWHYHEKSYFTFIQKGGNVEHRKNESVECRPGMLLFYNSDDRHYNDKGQNRSQNFNVEIEESWFRKYQIDKTKIAGTLLLSDPGVKSTMLKIFSEVVQKDAFSKLAVEGYLLGIFSRLLRQQLKATITEPAWVRRVRDYLNGSNSLEATLHGVAMLAGVHPVTLSREFPRYFGLGFGEYIRNIRCEKACQMLSKKYLPLEEIALEVGFADTSHLISIFKKKYKMTPSQYRSQL